MMTLPGQINQALQSSEASRTTQTEKKANRTVASGFDALFSTVASAPHLNLALQKHPEQGNDSVHKACNAPDDKQIPSHKAISKTAHNTEEAPASQEKETTVKDTDKANNAAAPEQTNAQTTQAGANDTSASVVSSPQTAAEQMVVVSNNAVSTSQNAQPGVQTDSQSSSAMPTQNASTAAQPALDKIIALLNGVTPAESSVLTDQTQAVNVAALKTGAGTQNNEKLVTALSELQKSTDQTSPLLEAQVASAVKEASTPLPQTTVSRPEVQTSVLEQAVARSVTQPAEPQAVTKLPDTRTDALFKELVGAIKLAVVSGPQSQQTSSFTMGFGANNDSSSMMDQGIPKQSDSNFSLLVNRDATPTIGMPGNGTIATSRAELPSESMVSAPRSLENLDAMAGKASITRDGNQLLVTLKPEGLGKLDINVSLEKGLLNAQIQVSDPAVKHLIENNLQQIMNALAHEGLTVDGFSVSLRYGQTNDGNGQGMNGFMKPSESNFVNTTVARPYDQNSMISIFV
jgi:flagellar hook-length control protein FliK